MSSMLGLPARGSDVTILITRVHLHPFCELVEFWGKFSHERTTEYQSLAREIQSPGNSFKQFEGNPGDKCLVQIDGTWYRSRIVSRNVSNYSVFLIDKGKTSGATANMLAWGKKEYFHLPPEVEFCVLANVLPLSVENRWSFVALEFLKSLSGQSVQAHVQDVIVPHRTFILHIPCISKQMYEVGFAKKLAPDMFQNFVLMSMQAHTGVEASPETRKRSFGASERLHKQELYMYPELPAATVETVIVTEVTNPQRIFCQLKVFSQELKKLSEKITQCFEGRMTNCIVGPEMIGYPCAARGSDGKWYRSVLQQVLPANKLVEVLNVDYGTKQFVLVENIRPLASEFFRMPVVTYICSLHGISDKGVGWTTTQTDYLRTLLLNKTVIAKFEYQSISEGVHYVTLYGDENTNINNLFGSKERCFLECEKTLNDYAIRSSAYSRQHPSQQEIKQRQMLPTGQALEDKQVKEVENWPVEELSLNTSHVAFLHHAFNPSEFWIQTQKHAKELDILMNSIYHLYKESTNKHAVRNPTVGLYCAAKAEDGDFYRATVSEVGETQIKVFFVDYGNSEVVDKSNIRILPEELKKLPWLALKCTMAGVKPKGGKWSQDAIKFFIETLTDKCLNVHVTAKYGDTYVVQVTDPEAHGERNLSKLMCSLGFAEREETHKLPKTSVTMKPGIMPATHHPNARLSGIHRNSGMSFQAKNTVDPANNERTGTFKESLFPIGSVLDVTVSYIESPNDFWCQLVQNAGHLKLLMQDIQAHYAGSEFQPLVESVCVVRHPDNGMWYRAYVIHKHETPDVDVLFVDYGQTETVSLYNLRNIRPEFLTLNGQAFRCSLLNPVDPMCAVNDWNKEATERFHDFVETAASSLVTLKCTIYAVMYNEQKIIFNIVDLETPFESVCTSMANLVERAPSKKASGPSFRLDTYYFSTHNVKTGTEEQVTVTCVNSVNQFYCQLERNTDMMKELKKKVNLLCRQLENVKLSADLGTLCFAKFTDGQWYRGQIMATKPSILVHFVDYGDTIEVDKSDLLPVPTEAKDIMSVPVQAVVCSLSDVPKDVSSEVNSWFETSATECKFQALVVAREPNGKLLVELYHRNVQINAKIKKMFQLEMQTEKVVQDRKATEASAYNVRRSAKVVPSQATGMDDHTQTKKNNNSASQKTHQIRDETKSIDVNQQPASKPLRRACENVQKVRAGTLKLYRPPHQRQSCTITPSNMGNDSEPAADHIKPGTENLPTDHKLLMKSDSHSTEFQKGSNVAPEAKVEKTHKFTDLPATSIRVGMEEEIYVSHCNSPLSFYVQLVKEEDELFSLADKLNDQQATPQTNCIKDLHPGDLVQAEFAGDSFWYRAVVREIHGNTTAIVEFVDFGNTAMMPISKLARLNEPFMLLPVYSTHCMLSDAAALRKEEALNPEVVATFRKDIGSNVNMKLKCRFIQQSGSVWEVSLVSNGVHVMCKAPTRLPTEGSKITPENCEQVMKTSLQNPELTPEISDKSQLYVCSLRYRQQTIQEGQQLAVYVTAIDNAQAFWCQPANSEELVKISLRVSEVGDVADHKLFDTDSLSLGSPCIALFSDQLWYRGEVLNKDEDELSILFVDYGNKSQVKRTDVREMPADLFETPSQAFLCELEGFDASHGSWDTGAADELSALIADNTLQLTVIAVTREEGKSRCIVLLECEGKVINEAMKSWWRSSIPENNPDMVGLSTLSETPLSYDPAEKESVLPEGQTPQETEIQEMDINELVDLHTTNEAFILASSPKNSECSDKSLHLGSFAAYPQVEKGQTLVSEGVKIFPTFITCQTESNDILPSDSGIEDPTSPTHNTRIDLDILTLGFDKNVVKTDKGCEEAGASVMDVIGLDDSNSPSDVYLQKSVDKPTSDLKTPNEAGLTYNMGGSSDLIYSGSIEKRHDCKAATAKDRSVTSVTKVPRYSVPNGNIGLHETTGMTSEDSKHVHKYIHPSSVLCVHQLFGQKIEAGDGVLHVSTNVKNVLLSEAETVAHHKDPCSEHQTEFGDISLQEETPCITAHNKDLIIEEDALTLHEVQSPDREPQTHAVPHPDMRLLVEEVTCLVGDICLMDVCDDEQRLDEQLDIQAVQDQTGRAETEDVEQLASKPLEENKDFNDGVLDEESSPSSDYVEQQLSTETHASLIHEESADSLPAEQLPEE